MNFEDEGDFFGAFAFDGEPPRVDLPEILLEIAARTEFPTKFTHVSERESRVSDLAISLCAVLVEEACNRGTWVFYTRITLRSAPPLTTRVAPVMKLAASETRKTTASPMSSGFPRRPKGTPLA